MSFCTACGAKNNDGSTFCISCGARLQNNVAPSQPVTPQPMYRPPVQSQQVYSQPAFATPQTNQQPLNEKPSRKCLAAGILSIIFSCLGLSLIFSPVAIVKGANVLKKYGPTGSAIAAIVLGVIGLLLTGLFVYLIFGIGLFQYINAAGSSMPPTYYYY